MKNLLLFFLFAMLPVYIINAQLKTRATGDVNCDNKVSVLDVTTLVKQLTTNSYNYITEYTGTYSVTIKTISNGTVSTTSPIIKGQDITLNATPIKLYKFIGWYNGDKLLSTNETYTFTPTQDITITSKFEALSYEEEPIYYIYKGTRYDYTKNPINSDTPLTDDEISSSTCEAFKESKLPCQIELSVTEESRYKWILIPCNLKVTSIKDCLMSEIMDTFKKTTYVYNGIQMDLYCDNIGTLNGNNYFITLDK